MVGADEPEPDEDEEKFCGGDAVEMDDERGVPEFGSSGRSVAEKALRRKTSESGVGGDE